MELGWAGMNLSQLKAAHEAAEKLRQADAAMNSMTFMTAPKIEVKLYDPCRPGNSALLVVDRADAFAWLQSIVEKREQALKAHGVEPK
jgi:hypothetical protein